MSDLEREVRRDPEGAAQEIRNLRAELDRFRGPLMTEAYANLAAAEHVVHAAAALVAECDHYGPGSLPPSLGVLNALRTALNNEGHDE